MLEVLAVLGRLYEELPRIVREEKRESYFILYLSNGSIRFENWEGPVRTGYQVYPTGELVMTRGDVRVTSILTEERRSVIPREFPEVYANVLKQIAPELAQKAGLK